MIIMTIIAAVLAISIANLLPNYITKEDNWLG